MRYYIDVIKYYISIGIDFAIYYFKVLPVVLKSLIATTLIFIISVIFGNMYSLKITGAGFILWLSNLIWLLRYYIVRKDIKIEQLLVSIVNVSQQAYRDGHEAKASLLSIIVPAAIALIIMTFFILMSFFFL